jgi:hypothetical protein
MLFPGVVEMAMRAVSLASERGMDRPVFIAPLVWKLRFTRDVTRELEREMRYVEQRLAIRTPAGDLADRVYHAYRSMLAREASELRFASDPLQDYFGAQARLLSGIDERIRAVLRPYSDELPPRLDDAAADLQAVLRPAERWLRNGEGTGSSAREVDRLVKAARRCLRLLPHMYTRREWTQEHVAENIKRLRFDYCHGRLRDRLHRLVPMPAGPRVAHIRVPAPLDMRALCEGVGPADEMERSGLLVKLRHTMQCALDALCQEIAPLQKGPVLRNPFWR